MWNVLKAIAALLAVLALCVPLILWSAEEGATSALDPSSATLTVPPTVVVATTGAADATTTTTTQVETEEPAVSSTTTTEPIRITVAAVGDVLTHDPIVDSVRSPVDGSYDFRPVFGPVAPYLRQADYTVASLETRLAGAEFGYSGYPIFNSPEQLAPALRWAGVDLVATANNHSLDLGQEGIAATLDSLDRAWLDHVGTYRSAEERAKPHVVDIQGIRVGFVNATATLNGDALPADQQFAVARLDVDQVIEDAVSARMWGADVVIALLHYGNEYDREPNQKQQDVTQKILSGGVDVVLGSHPHVVQPIEHVFEYGGSKVTNKFVVYSLGNFVSAQRWRYSDSGLVAYVHLEKRGLRTYVTGVSYLPVYVQQTELRGKTSFRVLPVLPGLRPESDLPISPGEEARMAAVWEELRPLLYRPNENISPIYPGRTEQ